jgi:MFS family permease
MQLGVGGSTARASAPSPGSATDADAEAVGVRFIALYVLALAGLWVALLTPVIEALSLRIDALAPLKSASGDLSHVTLVGALCALVGNVFWGRLSDRTTSRWGKRRPWLVIGMVGGTIGLAIIVVSHSILFVAIGWCIAQLMYNAALAALVATVPDHVPVRQRGLISGLVGGALPIGLVAGTYIVKAVNPSTAGMVLLPAGIGLIGVLAFAVFLPDRPASPEAVPPYRLATFLETFWVNPRKHPDFAWVWFSRVWLWLGISICALYQVYYLIFHLHKSPAQIPSLVLTSTLIGASAILLSSIVGGRISDKLGRRKVFIVLAGLLYGCGLLVIATTHAWHVYLLGVGIHGLGEGLFLGVDLALANDVLPSKETAAHDLGVLNIGQALPQALAPTIGPVLLAIHGPNNYVAVYLAGAACCFIGGLTIWGVRSVR